MSGSAVLDGIAIASSTAKAWAQELNAKGRLSLKTVYQPDSAGRLRLISIRTNEP
jgi:hypothetical protein